MGGEIMEEKKYTIKDISKMIDIKEPTIRKYENDFNLKIPRNEIGHRYYTESEVKVYQQIKAMKDKGAGTEIIKNILEKSVDAIDQKEQALELVTIDRLTGAELKEMMLNQFADILAERDAQIQQQYEKRIDQLEKKMEYELERQRETIQEQITSENEKLMKYIAASREEEQNKKSLWKKLFGSIK